MHATANGRRYLVLHGDEFDVVVRAAKWLAFLGDRGYELALGLNDPLNWVRRQLGLGYWSLSAYLNIASSGRRFHRRVRGGGRDGGRRRGVHGIICGHIHHANDRMIDGTHYLNCGDWVESCTAIVETLDGQLRTVAWSAREVVAA